MRKRCLSLALGALAIIVPSLAHAAGQKGAQTASPPDMDLYYLLLLLRGKNWTPDKTPEVERIEQAHAAYMAKLLETGKALVAGPFVEDGSISGVAVLKAASPGEASMWARSDPAIRAGRLGAELHPWYGPKGVMTPHPPTELATYYFVLLHRGANWTADDTPEVQRLQEAHMANIRKLAEAGSLVVAGPFGDKSERRGVFVFRAGSLDEAKALCDTDPAVRAGRLAPEVHTWLVPKGSFP